MKKKPINKHDKTEKQEATKVLGSSQSSMTMTWIPALLVALITFLVYLPALKNGFVSWDDPAYVYENQIIQYFDVEFLKWSFTAVVSALWHPLTLISLALDHAIWGLNPLGYHLTNIIIHSVNTFLVFVIITQLIEYRNLSEDNPKVLITAFSAAILFGIHPLHVESVAWVSERKDVLSAFFFLLTLLAYIKYVQAKGMEKMYFYSLSLISFILALMSKPMVITLPVVLLILDYYPFRRLELKNAVILEKLPFFLLSFLTALVTLWAHKTNGALPTLERLPLTMRILSATYAYIFYLFKMVIPFNLAPLYPYPDWMDFFTFKYTVAYILFLLIILSVIWSVRRHRLFSTIWLYYFIMLLPVIGIVQVGKQMAADRYTYLPSLGPFFLISLGLAHLFTRSSRNIRFAVTAVIIFISAILANTTVKQISIWYDSITFWSYESKLFPSAPIPHYNLGVAYYDQRRFEEAIQEYTATLKLRPNDSLAHNNLGNVYFSQGRLEEASWEYEKAVEINANDPRPYTNLGIVNSNKGNLDKAMRYYRMALKLDPDFMDAHYNLGRLYLMLGLKNQAVREFESVLKLKPDFLPARKAIDVM